MTKRARGYAPRLGTQAARTWATAYGSAWLLSSDLVQPPGLFTAFFDFQHLERTLRRCGVEVERIPFNGKTYLYRLSPETVRNLTYGGVDGNLSA